MNNRFESPRRRNVRDDRKTPAEKRSELHNIFVNEDEIHEKNSKGTPLSTIVNICQQPPQMADMEAIQSQKCIFMITPFKYDSSHPYHEPQPINYKYSYIDRWDGNHVRMPCSPNFIGRNGQLIWSMTQELLVRLKDKCDRHIATTDDLKSIIKCFTGRHCDIYCLEILINTMYSSRERDHFMSTVLSNICSLALNVHRICSQPPPLLRTQVDRSVTMSQQQAASLLACAFFCLFPFRSDHERASEYQNFQDPNFYSLYQYGPAQKIEKLKCILHYFRRITEKMPNGVISFRRFALSNNLYPKWSNSMSGLSLLHLTANKKIEDVNCALHVDFANKYIGGGVLGSGCVQEEIRFTICPEMLVSLLICEKMEDNECIFLIGCERYSLYKGYANTFQFDGDYHDNSPKDNWGRKWCHLVAMDATFFRDPSIQYNMRCVKRELIKAYASFRPRKTKIKAETLFGIATGSWGCGVFNGDKQLKAIIQLMAASEAERPLIYAAYLDYNLVNSFFQVYEYLCRQHARVGDLYRYLERYSTRHDRLSLFEFILKTPISSLKS